MGTKDWEAPNGYAAPMNEKCAVCGHPADTYQPALKIWLCRRVTCELDAWDKFLPHYEQVPDDNQ